MAGHRDSAEERMTERDWNNKVLLSICSVALPKQMRLSPKQRSQGIRANTNPKDHELIAEMAVLDVVSEGC